MTQRIDAAAASLRASGLRANAWQKNGKHRIYLRVGGKDISAYFDFDEDAAVEEIGDGDQDLLAGSALKVFTDADRTSRKWAINRCKQVKHGIMVDCFEAGLIPEVCSTWNEVIL